MYEMLNIDNLMLRPFQKLWSIPAYFLPAILMPMLIQRSKLILKINFLGLSRKERAILVDFFTIFRSRKKDKLKMIGVDGTMTMVLLLRLPQPSILIKKVSWLNFLWRLEDFTRGIDSVIRSGSVYLKICLPFNLENQHRSIPEDF